MEIEQHPPKPVQYSILLYTKLGTESFFKKITGRFKGQKPNSFTKPEIKEFLQSHYNQDCSTSISNFLQQLEEDGIIKKDGWRKKENNRNVRTWKFNKNKLEKELDKTTYMKYFNGGKPGFDKSFISEKRYGNIEDL